MLTIAFTAYAIVMEKRGVAELNKTIAIADKFKPPADWKLVEETKDHNGFIRCTPNDCPKVYRRYRISRISLGDINKIKSMMKASDLVSEGSIKCHVSSNDVGKYGICTARAKYENQYVFMNAMGDNETGIYEFVLTVNN